MPSPSPSSSASSSSSSKRAQPQRGGRHQKVATPVSVPYWIVFAVIAVVVGSLAEVSRLRREGAEQLIQAVYEEEEGFTPVEEAARFLESDEGDGDNKNNKKKDDIDGSCRNYLKKFLTGSTDVRDECTGLINAYENANCIDDINASDDDTNNDDTRLFFADSQDSNHTNKDGDDDDTVPMLDDFYSEFECCDSIQKFYRTHCNPDARFNSFTLFGIVAVLVLCGAVRSLIRSLDVQWFPEAAGCILVGAVVGALVDSTGNHKLSRNLVFDNDLFLGILLPPMIFEASLTIHKPAFRKHLVIVILFAIFGTLISAGITGFMVWGITKNTAVKTIHVLDSFVFGALISSIDPVATLGILSSMGMSSADTLFVVVFGESLMNDGVAIVLFDTLVENLKKDAVADDSVLLKSVVQFLTVLLGSIVMGLIFGFFCTIYFWWLRGRQAPVIEVFVFFCWALVPYYVSDAIGWSGIISIMTMGFVMDAFVIGGNSRHDPSEGGGGSYALHIPESEPGEAPVVAAGPLCEVPTWTDVHLILSGVGHMSQVSKHHVGFVAEVISAVMESAIMAYLGVFLFHDREFLDLGLNCTAIFSCVVSRGLMVALVSLLYNAALRFGGVCCKPSANRNPGAAPDEAPFELDGRMQLILLFAGIRGAVSMALVESIPLYNVVTKYGSKVKPALKAMTTSSIAFTIFFFSAATFYILKGHDSLVHLMQQQQETPTPQHSSTMRRAEESLTTATTMREGLIDLNGMPASPPQDGHLGSL